MIKLYPVLQAALFACILLPNISKAQDCSTFSATTISYESRCAATGSIKVFASGGTGSYKYKVIGPVTSNFTSLDLITGLPAGSYIVVINDIITNCTVTLNNVVVAGDYQDPRFTLTNTDVSCDNGNNATITATGVQYGRPPYTFSIVAPSPAGVGTTNSTGVFAGLKAGDYTIRLTDSCGGIQTRLITVNNYTWYIDAYPFTKNSCTNVTGYIRAIDSKGNISTSGGIPGFMYGVVRFAGDTIWSSNPNFSFNPNGSDQLGIVVKDACNKIKKAATTVSFTPTVNTSVNTYNSTCNSFSASLTNVKNFYDPEFCIYDNNNVLIDCNSTGVFTNLVYGSYCITAHDSCSDTIITRCFTETAPPISVSNTVAISNRNCNTFTASIADKTGLTNPTYCIYDEFSVLITCNSTGVFDSLNYGSYCIEITDGCVDTILTRCFTTVRPVPMLLATISAAYTTCDKFGVVIGGDSLSNPRYCLMDSLGNEIICNNTGVFDSIPFGNYCVNVYDSCYDTTMVRCFSVLDAYIENDIQLHIDNKVCSTFSVTAVSSNIIGGQYCLYSSTDSLIGCNNSGVFDNIPYGDYCVKTTVTCPDTTFSNCFSASPPVPSVDASVKISNKTCSGFTASITGEENLTDPQYCLYDNNDSLVTCNTSGQFDTLAYGDYCIKITNSCYDTTITRCFTASPSPLSLSLQLKKSCVYGYAKFTFTLSNAAFPVSMEIYDPSGSLYLSRNYNSSTINIDSIPEVTNPDKYKIVVHDNCGGADSLTTEAIASKLVHTPVVTNKCPSATWLNGSGNIKTTITTNLGSVSVKIIKKDGNNYNLNPGASSGTSYTFNDLEPAVYIIRYKANDNCSVYLYDTVTIQPYQYPSLNRTSAYQCDNDGFTVAAVVDYGLGPFAYEIIGSTPSSPSIITSPQSSPVFNINNGTSYSLIRLRVLDACGNASLEDASVLPLADNMITATFNCFMLPTTLSVDSVNGATFSWYKKDSASSADSTFLGLGTSIYIPNVLPTDTGIYSAHLNVNAGCIKRSYFYNLNGDCFPILPVVLKKFTGKYAGNKILLDFDVQQSESLREIIIETRSSNGTFKKIGHVVKYGNSSLQQYNFIDKQPGTENYYRLKLVTRAGYTYSNTIYITGRVDKPGLNIYPNPANSFFIVQYKPSAGHQYRLQLLNAVNQLVKEIIIPVSTAGLVQVKRDRNTATGIYFIRLVDIDTGETSTQKIIFR